MQREGNLIRVAPLAGAREGARAGGGARTRRRSSSRRSRRELIPLSYATATQILPRMQRAPVAARPRLGRRAHQHAHRHRRRRQHRAGRGAGRAPRHADAAGARSRRASSRRRPTFTRDIGIQWGGDALNSAGDRQPDRPRLPVDGRRRRRRDRPVTDANGLRRRRGAASPNFAVNLPAAVGTGAGGALGLSLGSVDGNFNINLRLSALENSGSVRIISAPKIMTLDNNEATIEQGTSIPISVVSARRRQDAVRGSQAQPHGQAARDATRGSIVDEREASRATSPTSSTSAPRRSDDPARSRRKTEMLVARRRHGGHRRHLHAQHRPRRTRRSRSSATSRSSAGSSRTAARTTTAPSSSSSSRRASSTAAVVAR